jgi:uncharacterized membrane protein YfcA
MIGFVGGMVGLILGVLRFPFIISSEVSVGVAAGTNIGISTMAAIPAAIRHFRQNNVNIRIFLVMGITGAVGAFCGSLLTRYVPVYLLLAFIGIIVSYESFILIRGKSDKTNSGLPTKSKNKIILTESIIGFAIGLLGGLVGLVLGSVRMPTMISVLKMNPSIAVGTNLAASSVMGLSALIGHLLSNEVDFLILVVLGSTAMIGGYIGASFTQHFSERNLKRIIGTVLMVVAVTIFIRIYLGV